MARRGDPLWDLDGPEYELADMGAASKEGSWFDHRAARQDDRDVRPASLPANYEHKTKLLDNNSQMLVALIEGMRK